MINEYNEYNFKCPWCNRDLIDMDYKDAIGKIEEEDKNIFRCPNCNNLFNHLLKKEEDKVQIKYFNEIEELKVNKKDIDEIIRFITKKINIYEDLACKETDIKRSELYKRYIEFLEKIITLIDNL